MSDSFRDDDLARLIAIEHAFNSLALISASNFAFLANTTPSAAVGQFRSAIESSLYDSGDMSPELQALVRVHLKRMFDHVAAMAKHADEGVRSP